MKRFLSVALITLAVPTVVFAQRNIDSNSHAWSTYHWARTSNPFTIKLGNNTSGPWTSLLSQASADWSKSSVMDTTVVAGQANKRCSATAGRVEVCNSSYGRNGWLGLASISLSGGHISQGTAKMNDSYVMNAGEKKHVMCQEVGHTFGLGHTSENGTSQGTCMDYYSNTSDTDMTSTSPNAHDYAQLDSIYSHVDSTTTILSTPSAQLAASSIADRVLAQISLDSRAQWGVEVDRSEDGRHSTFVQDFGNGDMIVTEVYWATEANLPENNTPRPGTLINELLFLEHRRGIFGRD